MTKQQVRYYRLKSEGCCPKCSSPQDRPGKAVCSACQAKNSAYERRYNPAQNPAKRAYWMSRYRTLKAERKCVWCKVPLGEGDGVRCPTHAAALNVAAQLRLANRDAAAMAVAE